jgi:hypothetical protein
MWQHGCSWTYKTCHWQVEEFDDQHKQNNPDSDVDTRDNNPESLNHSSKYHHPLPTWTPQQMPKGQKTQWLHQEFLLINFRLMKLWPIQSNYMHDICLTILRATNQYNFCNYLLPNIMKSGKLHIKDWWVSTYAEATYPTVTCNAYQFIRFCWFP